MTLTKDQRTAAIKWLADLPPHILREKIERGHDYGSGKTFSDKGKIMEVLQQTACIAEMLADRLAAVPSALSGDAGETLESIIAWGDQTFGPCSQDRAIERAGEEWSEMEEDGADVPIEAADVIICLLRIPGILDAINRKMTINRGRTWDVRPDGTGYHVKAATLPSHKGAGDADV